MAKSIVLGNTNTLIGLDSYGQLYDLYFPYIGLENHTSGKEFQHKIGVWVDNNFSWVDDGKWSSEVKYMSETMCSDITLTNKELLITLKFRDLVYNEKNIFLRRVEVINESDRERDVKLFFNQQFSIYESLRGDTCFYDPGEELIIHYKGRRVFAVNGISDGRIGFQDYSIGLLGIEGKEGTYKDAEDGVLSKNNIEHGLLDSVIGFDLQIGPKQKKVQYYWLVIGKYYEEVKELNSYVLQKTPEYLMHTTQSYWKSWSNQQNFSFYEFSPELISLFKTSLLIVRSHVNENGAVIASCDSDLLKHGRDNYSYVWPRDGALTVVALDKAGYHTVSKKFFQFCNEIISKEGYFMHKYLADLSLGSSWHPWIKNGRPILPIQEDETALVIWAFWQHYTTSHDLEFVELIYNSLVKKATEFMLSHMDPVTNLPKPSYDLWEEKYGIHTFTAASVYGALVAASGFAAVLGKESKSNEYSRKAAELKQAILDHLYDKETGAFYKRLKYEEGKLVADKTVDSSSIYGIWRFGVLEPDDEIVRKAVQVTKQKLTIPGSGGVCRYENDNYFRVDPGLNGNPWIISTLWLAQHEIATATDQESLCKIKDTLDWVNSHSLHSGVLPEQVNPHTGEPLSATPLTWSHAEYIQTVIDYLKKAEKLGLSDMCLPNTN